MRLITTLRSEILKTKRTASLYFTLIGAAPIPLIFLLNVLTGGGDLEAVKKDPINLMFNLNMERNGLVFLPMFVILVCTLLPQIEYRNNTWKQVLTSPQTKGSLFLAKFLNINLLILLFLLANLVYMGLIIIITSFFHPQLNIFQHHLDFPRLLTTTSTAYITMLAITTFQFWLGLRFRNFIIPIAVGFGLWIMGMIVSLEFQAGFANFFPYSLQTSPFNPKLKSLMTQIGWTSVGYAALFLIVGFIDFRKRRLTS